ncbi:DUF1345 domain-containing protein [Microbacterium mangrovi]|uniref:DUF1345 domain-containing protein n=1 Tax=Microbacterium mangrovi TaxID=1348253 RepID=UPI000AF7FF9B|nr:DUF1345 domain-containing protein [Microbacterium mangrovi]
MPTVPLHHQVRTRFLVSLVAGTIAAAVVIPFLGVAAGLLCGWAILAAVNTTWVLGLIWPMGAVQTRAHATAEDPGRHLARLIATVGSVVSLGAVGVVLVEAKSAPAPMGFILALIALVSVAASWALIQTDYTLRLAHVYYTDPVGGIQFNQEEDPMYTDFAYISFDVGLTYQIADTNVTRNDIRRVVIAQSLLGYLFGAVILASVINLLAGLG